MWTASPHASARTGPEGVIAFDNGFNDWTMLKIACLGIAVLGA